MARGAEARVTDIAPAMEERQTRLAEAAVDGYADTNEVREFAATLPDKYLHCREMNHNWRPYDVGRHSDGGWERTLRCSRCYTRKVQHLDNIGMLIGSAHYIHPDGYLHAGLGRIVGEGRGALRMESIRRLTGGEDS